MDTRGEAAKRLLTHYMRLIARNSGVQWHSDNDSEVGAIIDLIIDAAADEGAKRALRALPASVQESLESREERGIREEAEESIEEHRDNIRRAKEQMAGLRRGMGLE